MAKGKTMQKVVVEEYYEVERLLAKRYVKGNAEYLVKWRGFEENESTWQAAANLVSVLDLVLQFENQLLPPPPTDDCRIDPPAEDQSKIVEDKSKLDVSGQFAKGPPNGEWWLNEETVDQRDPRETTQAKDTQLPLDVSQNETNLDIIPLASETKSPLLLDRNENSKIMNNSSMEIMHEVKQMDARFKKLAEKVNHPQAKPPKKQQKQNKRSRKRAESALHEQIKPITQIIPIDATVAISGTQDTPTFKEPNDNKRQLRERKDLKPPEDAYKSILIKEKEKETRRRASRAVTPEAIQVKEDGLKQGSRGATMISNEPIANNNQVQTSTTVPLQKDKHKAYKVPTDRSNPSVITEIRMLENACGKIGEYLVEFGSGEIKILKTIDLMVASPLEFSEYLESRHRL